MTRRAPLLLLLLLTACGRGHQDGLLFPGTVEVDESDAAALVGGRVVELRVDEGDTVAAGDTLALLTQTSLPALVEERRARLAIARARLADLRRGSRAPELERAEAELAAAEAEVGRTARDLARLEPLARSGVVAAQALDQATAAAETAARRRDAARASLELAREGSRTDQIRAAEAEVRSAEAALQGASADLHELAVLSPVDGVVLRRLADPGEVLAAGTPVVTVADVARRWVRVYLPARLLARIATGTPAVILPAGGTAAAETRARLGSVSSKAEFTPRAALTEEERADLLFAARIELTDPPPGLRPGLPVSVRLEPPAP